jgi:hypothetical protein
VHTSPGCEDARDLKATLTVVWRNIMQARYGRAR